MDFGFLAGSSSSTGWVLSAFTTVGIPWALWVLLNGLNSITACYFLTYTTASFFETISRHLPDCLHFHSPQNSCFLAVVCQLHTSCILPCYFFLKDRKKSLKIIVVIILNFLQF